MNVLLYCRVSRDKSGEVRSVKEQIDDLTKIADREGWTVTDTITDEGSASEFRRTDRANWPRVLDAVSSGTIDGVMFWEASRSTRDGQDWERFRRLAIDHDVKFIVGSHVYDLRDPDDDFSAGLTANLSRRESAIISKRVRRSTDANAEAGRPHGRRIYGYTRVYDDRGHLVKVIEDPATGPVVRRIFDEAHAGKTLRSIATGLNDDDVPTRINASAWRAESVKTVLDNPAYAARRVHRGKVVGDAAWPELVTPEVFDELQATLSRPSTAPRGPEVAHLLTGIAVCGGCGAPLRQISRKAPTATDPQRRRHSLTCRNNHSGCVTIREEPVTEWVTDVILARLAEPDAVEVLTADDTTDETRDRLTAEMSRLKEYLAGVERVAAETLDLTLLSRQTRLIQPQIDELDANIKALSPVDPAVAGLAGASDPRAAWDALPLTDRRRVVQVLVTPVVMPSEHAGRGSDPVEKRVRFDWR